MSFSREVKDEVLRQIPSRSCCRKALLSSFASLAGEGDGRIVLFSSAAMGRFLIHLLKRMKINRWGMGITPRKQEHAGKLILGESVPHIPMEALPSCCQKNFLRGAFLARGDIISPQKGYHAEIRFAGSKDAAHLAALLQRAGLQAGCYKRRESWVVFLKGGERIGQFLFLIGAKNAYLRFEEIRALKETRNGVRRQVNYESANVGRTVAAAGRQKKLFQALMLQKNWKNLPAGLRTAAEARLRFPSLSLRELAAKLRISKSALNHRIRRLEAIRNPGQ